jgi:hypothetical protein
MTGARKPKSKRKTLPRDFEELLKSGDLVKLQAVFDACDVDARAGSSKRTALSFDACPDALARWLVANGADLSAADMWGNTPLHSRARSWRGEIAVLLELGANVHATNRSGATPLHEAADGKRAKNARLLIEAGADAGAKNAQGLTPLEVALRGCSNAQLTDMQALVPVLLAAGAARTPAMKTMVEQIGQTFEFHREAYNPDHVGEASAALDFLYATFDVPPVPRRKVHDGVALITVKATTWQKQHSELWNLLVPSKGPAKTVQGEVIRIAGRISDEWERNGGANWDGDYSEMARALLNHVGSGVALEPHEVDEIAGIVRSLSESGGAGNARLAALAVAWVLRNPRPVPLPTPSYRR